MTERLYKNRREPRSIPVLRATWYYLGQLAEQMGMTTEDYAEFALKTHVMDRHQLLRFDRKWGDSSKERRRT